MIFTLAVTATILAWTDGCILAQVPSQCPQPTEENPFPEPFRYGHRDDCRFYFTCNDGTPTVMQCQEGYRFSHIKKTCVPSFSEDDVCTRENAERECSKGAKFLIAHPQSCQGYYNCSDTRPPGSHSFFGHYEKECPYPQLFDVKELKCKNFKETECGPGRVAAKDACDYLDNKCGGFQCEPCLSRLPSCMGKKNGSNPYPNREWTPWYIQCDTDRTIEILTCEKHQPTGTTGFFSPEKMACVSMWEIPPHAPSCTGKEPGLYKIPSAANVYYKCHTAEVFYCDHGHPFNETSQSCEIP